MGPSQINAIQTNPNQLALTEIAVYQRCITASIDRVWENVLDWEHLPWLHRTSFNYVSLDIAGDWGWRTWSNPEHTAHVELCVDKPNSRYVARSYQNGKQTSEIWTDLYSEDKHTDIKVAFLVADVAAHSVEKLGRIYLGLYQTLWDEDEIMMVERQAQLDNQKERNNDTRQSQLILGSATNWRDSLPRTESLANRRWIIREHQQNAIVHAATCPHLLGPLQDAEIMNNSIRCPWHGYDFDIQSGKCIKPETANCKMPTPPRLREAAGNMVLSFD